MAKRNAAKRKNEEVVLNDIFESSKKNTTINTKIELKFKNETQKRLAESIKKNDLTICTGPAGCGKSLVALFSALSIIKEDPIYKSILLLKSMTQLNNETLPPLPGDASEKMQYQNASFFDSLVKLVGEKICGELVNKNIVKFDVIGSFRGRSISDSIIVLDEVQNITHDNLKTILTRISENTKIILLGDPDQIDIKNKKDSSLARFVKKVKENPMSGVEVVEFSEDDIVRHRLTKYLLSIFKESSNENKILLD